MDPVVSVELRKKWRQEQIDGLGENGWTGGLDESENRSLMRIRGWAIQEEWGCVERIWNIRGGTVLGDDGVPDLTIGVSDWSNSH